MRLAIIQQQVVLSDKSANFSQVETLVDEVMTGPEAADVIVLPELWSTGYALEKLSQLASMDGQEEAEFLGSLARKHKVWFAGGSVAAKTRAGIRNRAQVIDREGRLQAFYDKVHLVPMLDEHKHLVAGDKVAIFKIEDVTFGFAICYDIRFCEFIHKLALEGAQAIVVSAQWPEARIHHWKSLLTARAIENQCYVVAANNMADGPTQFGGASMAIDPVGDIICELQKKQELRVVEIHPQRVKKTRENIPVFQDRRPDVY